MKKICGTCKAEKDIKCYSKNPSKVDGLSYCCQDCNKMYQKEWYKKNKKKHIENLNLRRNLARKNAKEFAWQYISTHSCVDCNQSNPLTLDFDHVKGKKKENVSRMIADGVSIFKLEKEINKCVIRCANCHRIKTASTNGNWKVIKLNNASVTQLAE